MKYLTKCFKKKEIITPLAEPYGYKYDITLPNKCLIEVNHLSKVYKSGVFGKRNKVALDNVSFKIFENMNTAILGANGAGKTTLIEIICGLEKPTRGNVVYHLGTPNYKNQIGIQFQASNYPNNLSVYDIIKFVIKLHNIKKQDRELQELFNIFGIQHLLRKTASNLSGGESQRLNTMLALIHNPKILFLDELSTGLDIKIRTKIKQFVKNYAKQHNITIVIVSHDIKEIEYLAEYLIFLQNGKKVVHEKIKTIQERYGSLSKFLDQYIA